MSHVAGFFPATKSRASWWQEAALSDVGHGLRNSALTATNALFTTDRSGNSQETEWSDSTFSQRTPQFNAAQAHLRCARDLQSVGNTCKRAFSDGYRLFEGKGWADDITRAVKTEREGSLFTASSAEEWPDDNSQEGTRQCRHVGSLQINEADFLSRVTCTCDARGNRIQFQQRGDPRDFKSALAGKYSS
jgi:hypothetical protein